jgi:hypothetical protein
MICFGLSANLPTSRTLCNPCTTRRREGKGAGTGSRWLIPLVFVDKPTHRPNLVLLCCTLLRPFVPRELHRLQPSLRPLPPSPSPAITFLLALARRSGKHPQPQCSPSQRLNSGPGSQVLSLGASRASAASSIGVQSFLGSEPGVAQPSPKGSLGQRQQEYSR